MSADNQGKGPLNREEYERRHKALRREYSTFSRRVYRILAAMVVCLLISAGTSAYLLNENNEQNDDITSSLIEGCESTGNTLRRVVRQFGETQIQQIHRDQAQSDAFQRSGAYARLFPGFSEEELKALLQQARASNLRKIREIEVEISEVKPVNCEERYKAQ